MGEIVQELIDFTFRAHVDAARGLIENQDVGAPGWAS